MAVMFLQQTLGSGRLEVVDGAYRPVGNRVTVDDFDRFAEYIKQFGVTYIGNTWSSHRLITSLRQRVETHEVVTIENEDIKLDVVPNLGGRIVSLIHKKTGTELLNRMSPEDNFYPVIGGYEEITALTWGCTGFTNSYEAEVKGNSITLTVLTPNGLRFKRTITLPSKGSMITFSSSIINESASSQTYKLVCRMHLKADPDMTELTARSQSGSFIKPTPTEEKTTAWPFLSFSRRYDGVNKPTGLWRLKNRQNGLTIENRFENSQVEGCHLITEKNMNLALMEIHTAEHEVKPGDRIILKHTWEIK